MRSAPQKQPIPKIAVLTLDGNGPFSGVPSTAWRSGTRTSWSRPGSADPGSTIELPWRPKENMSSG